MPSDMCFPTWETHIHSVMCSRTRKTHFSSDMRSSPWETHIPSDSDMCSSTWETYIPSVCVPPPGKHISLVICVPYLPLAFHSAYLHASIKVSLSNLDAVSMLSCLTAATNLD